MYFYYNVFDRVNVVKLPTKEQTLLMMIKYLKVYVQHLHYIAFNDQLDAIQSFMRKGSM